MPADAGGLKMAIWERNGHILEDTNGHPVECPWCPCGDMTCDDIIAQKIAACEAAGAYYMRQAGFLYSLVDTTEEVIASIFHWISWTYDASRTIYVCNLNYLDCDCEEVLLLTMEFAAPPATIDLFGYAFLPNSSACAGGCEEQIATLIAQAVASGWTLHGEGVMVRKTSVDYPCYRFDLTKIPVMACADTGSSFVYITCDCYRSDITGDSYQLFRHLQYTGCECFDIRELILTYPDVFGVDDVSFGDDTVYTRDASPGGGSIYTYMCIPHSTSYDSYYCDYRNLYVIFDNTRIGMPTMRYYSYTPSAFLLEFDTNGRWLDGGGEPLKYDDITNGTLTFEGHVRPFTSSEENLLIWPHASSINWKGLTIRWSARNSNSFYGGSSYVGSYYSQSDAQAELDRLNNLPNKYGSNSFDASCNSQTYFYEPKASVIPPNYTATPVEGRIEYNQNTAMWDVYAPYYSFGQNGDNVVYNINFAMTNKGFLVNGQSGYSDRLDVAGFLDTIPEWTSPPTEASVISGYSDTYTKCLDPTTWEQPPCPEGTEKDTENAAIMSIPMYDMAFLLTIDEDMGGCMDSDWWQAVIEASEPEEEEEEDN